MVNVLLNYYNFDEDWAFESLQPYLQGKKVVVIPFAFRDNEVYSAETFAMLYGKNGEKYDRIIAPFFRYGIGEEDICWIDYFCDTKESALNKINGSQVILLCGGLPDFQKMRLEKFGIADAVKNFDGVVVGVSAGAMVQLGRYHITPDDDYPTYREETGLAMVPNVNLEVHFEDTVLQRQCSLRAKKSLGLDVYQMWHQGGLIVDKTVKIIGKVAKI